MASSERHWGDLDPVEDVIEKSISPQLVSLLIQKSMKPVPLGLYQPCGNQEPGIVELPPECSAMDEIILHSIKLRQYANKMEDIITEFKSKQNNNDLPDPPEMPDGPEWKPRHSLKYPLMYMESVSSPFTCGEGVSPHPLSKANAIRILRKSVATICSHIGYDDTSQQVLDVMTDVSQDYFIRFTRLLRAAADREMLSGTTNFPDILEKVFFDMGIGSMLTLHTFYQERVLIYRERLLMKCCNLAREYAQLTKPVIKEEPASDLVQTKLENDDDDGDVPEIHFPALGEGYAVDELQPSLEPGFQMLHSLEQEEQLQNMDPDEEINVSDSPSQEMSLQSSLEQATTPGGSRKNKHKRK